MRIARLLIFVMFVCLWPGTAHAARSWWGWLEELSGPGPFTGVLYSMPVVCWDSEGGIVSCENFKRGDGERNARVKRSLQITGGVLHSGQRPRFEELVGTGDEEANRRRVYAVPLNAAYMLRPHRSLDVGAGAGLVYFAGNGVEANARFVVIPLSASFRPLFFVRSGPSKPWQRVLSLEYQLNYITKGFKAADFGSSTATFRSGREFQHAVGVAVDIGELVKAR